MSLFVSLLTAGSNSHAETSENANALATDYLVPGVVGSFTNTAGVAPMTGAYAVNAQGSPNMTVAVSSGIAYVTATPSSQNSQTLRVRNTASANVTIAANSSGSTRYDYVYLSLDAAKAANPAVDASDVATLVTSRSSSNTTDNGTPPSFGLLLAVVTVSNGAASITNGNIADKRAALKPAASVVLPSNQLSNPYKFSVYRSANQPSYMATSGTYYTTQFDTVTFDTGGNFSTSTNTFTAPIAGFYFLQARVSIANGTNAMFANIKMFKNGTGGTILDFNQSQTTTTQGAPGLLVGGQVYPLAAGDTIIIQTACGVNNIGINGGVNTTWFGGYLVSAT